MIKEALVVDGEIVAAAQRSRCGSCTWSRGLRPDQGRPAANSLVSRRGADDADRVRRESAP